MRKERGGIWLLATAILLSTTAPVIAQPLVQSPSYKTLSIKDARKQAETVITPESLRAYLSFIASDELEGRDTPSRGLDTAAQFLATLTSRWGLKPGGDSGTYFQKIPLIRRRYVPTENKVTVGGKTLVYKQDYIIGGGSGMASGSLVYVSHGWYAPAKGMDPYKGLDIKGKVLVVADTNGPPGVTQQDLRTAPEGTYMDVEEYATKNGAVGVYYLPSSMETQAWERQLRFADFMERGRFTMSGPTEEPPGLPSVQLSVAGAGAIFAGEAMTLEDAIKPDSRPFALAATKKGEINLSQKVDRSSTQNVVAILEGSDTTLKDEYVGMGAHYDHIGISTRPNETGDVINNGADDDGSGTVALLNIAETLAKDPTARPKRSIVFIWHCGEEKGLWGSAYFTDHPTVPLKSIVSVVNIDMIGRSKKPGDENPRNKDLSGPNEIYVIGSRKLSTQLGDLVDKVNNDYTKMSYNYRYDVPNEPNRFYYRSDHYNYARKGIPIAFFFDGVHEDYHRVGDEVSKIDFTRYATIARTIALTVTELANRPERPVVDGKVE